MDNTLGFDAVKFIDQRTQDLVKGYVKELNEELTNKVVNIPPLIANACLLFYCIREDFTALGANMRVDRDMVRTVNVGQHTVYGKMAITPQDNKYIYKWTIEIAETNYQFFAFSLGIDSGNKAILNDDFSVSGPYGNTAHFYAFGSDGLKTGYRYRTFFPPKGKQYGEKCGKHDKSLFLIVHIYFIQPHNIYCLSCVIDCDFTIPFKHFSQSENCKYSARIIIIRNLQWTLNAYLLRMLYIYFISCNIIFIFSCSDYCKRISNIYVVNNLAWLFPEFKHHGDSTHMTFS